MAKIEQSSKDLFNSEQFNLTHRNFTYRMRENSSMYIRLVLKRDMITDPNVLLSEYNLNLV